MQILQDCDHCGRRVKVNQKGCFLKHYVIVGDWKRGHCVGSGKTSLETKEDVENNPVTSALLQQREEQSL